MRPIETFKKAETRRQEGGDQTASLNIELVQVHDIDSGSFEQDAPVITLVNGILAEAIRSGGERYSRRALRKAHARAACASTDVLHRDRRDPARDEARGDRALQDHVPHGHRRDSACRKTAASSCKSGGTEIDFRVNSMPTLFGEKIVLRMLGQGQSPARSHEARLRDTSSWRFSRRASRRPTAWCSSPAPRVAARRPRFTRRSPSSTESRDNLSTAEDPVEYNLEGINQVQINKDVGPDLRERSALPSAPGPGHDSRRRDPRLRNRRSRRSRPRSPATWCSPRCTRTTLRARSLVL